WELCKSALRPCYASHNPAQKIEELSMRRHSHTFTIADDEAVVALIKKLVGSHGSNQVRREKLLRALDDAARHYKDSNQKVRRAFFHGLLTGYAVALKLC